MSRMMIAAVALSLIATACSATATTTSTTAPTTTTTTSTTSTSTTTTSTTTTTMGEAAVFPGEPGTPTQLDSFTGITELSFAAEGLEIDFVSEGTYVGTAFECRTMMDFGGFGITATGVATPETAWVDVGQGFVEVGVFDQDLQTAISVCPANPLFWADGSFALPGIEGEPDTINGIPAQRVEFGEFLEALSSFGVPDLEGMEFEDAVVWIADDGGWVVAIDMTFRIPPESAGEFFGPGTALTEAAVMQMIVQIADPNDPTLTVELPTS